MALMEEYKDDLEHFERKLRMLINEINTYGSTKERRTRLDVLSNKIENRRQRLRELKNKKNVEHGLHERSSQNLNINE